MTYLYGFHLHVTILLTGIRLWLVQLRSYDFTLMALPYSSPEDARQILNCSYISNIGLSYRP